MALLFTNGSNVADDLTLKLKGASAVTSADVGGKTFVFAAGAVDNGLSVFQLGASGALTSAGADIGDDTTLKLAGVSGLTTISSGGVTYLVAAGPTDNGLSVFRVGVTGALTAVHDVADDATLKLAGVSRLASASVGGVAYLFAAGTVDDGISAFRVEPTGVLTSVGNTADTASLKLDGVKGLTTAVINGETYLFAAGSVDNGVSVLKIAANGSLTETSSIADNGTLNLAGASDVATGVVGGVTYLFVAGATDGGVSVFSVSNAGVLTGVANVADTSNLRLAGAESLTVTTFGTSTYLTVGGSESGVSMFKVETGGGLTFVENIDDTGARELSGVTHLHTASVAGTSYVLGAGAADDGISSFGLKPSGQLWYVTEGADSDARVVRVNSDGWAHATQIDNGAAGTGDDKLSSSFVADIGVDTAAGVYFTLTNNGATGLNGNLAYGRIGGIAAPTVAFSYGANVIVNGMQVDAIHHKIYVGYQDNGGTSTTNTGIRVYNYNTTTGALSDQNFLITAGTDNRPSEGGNQLLDPRDFALDPTMGTSGYLFYTELLASPGVRSVGLFRLDLANLAVTTQVVAQTQFPDAGTNGYIYDVEVDQATHLVYFTTQSFSPYDPGDPTSTNYVTAQNAVWYVPESASNGTATKVTLNGAVGANFYPGDMTFDQNTRQLYVESKEAGNASADDVIYVFQLDGAGTSATLVNTIKPGAFTSSTAAIQGMVFSHLPVLALSGTATAATEQAASATTLLTAAPTITDTDGAYLVGAKVQVTGGKFSSSESSTADDHLGYGASKTISGLAGATNITLSWDAASETLTLTGYDTIANYKTVLSQIVFWSTGDNPTNYGLNTSRTITWSVDDGTPDIPAGASNSGTTTLTIGGVNDAPVNTVSSNSGAEGQTIAVTGLQVSDVDTNPALQAVTVTLSAPAGAITLLTNVAGGVTAGQITSNGTNSVTISATLNAINATFAATNGVLFAGGLNVSGNVALTLVTNDGGAIDTDVHTLTITAVNHAPTVGGTGLSTLAASDEDVQATDQTNTVSTLFSGQFSDSGGGGTSFSGVAVTANASSGVAGQWQYFNAGWTDIGTASASSGFVLSASTPLRFAPAANFNGAAPTLTVRLLDNSAGTVITGAHLDTTSNGGSTSISTATVVLSHGVTAVNDAPTIVNGASVTLATVAEDSAPGAGETISALFASHFSDARDGSTSTLAGVAVNANAATAAQGVYQYLDGATWKDLPAVAVNNAFVLAAGTAVRFAPATNYFGAAPALTVSMIETSAATVTTGQTVDLTVVDGSTVYSAALTLSVQVTATNDAPVASGAAVLATINEDAASPAGDTVSNLFAARFSDVDTDSLGGVAITLNHAGGASGAWQYNVGGGWVAVGAPSAASALYLAAGAQLRFMPTANYNGAPGALEAYLVDSTATGLVSGSSTNVTSHGGLTHYSATAVTLSTSVTAVNDAPIVPPTATAVNATEQTAAVLLGAVSVSDVELDALGGGAGDYAGATFTVQRAVADASDTFAFDATSTVFTVSGANLMVGAQTVATFGVAGGVLTINFVSAAGATTRAVVNEILHHITYTNASDAPPASVSLQYALNDGGGQGAGGALSAGGAVTVAVANTNDTPTGAVTATGTAIRDQVLTANTTALVDPDGLGALSYTWQRGVGATFTDIGGATASTYTLVTADIGKTVRVVVSYTDQKGTAETVTGAATATILGVNTVHTGAVTLNGTATEDQVLTANTSALTDVDGLGTLAYQWQRGTGATFASIGGATGATYALGDADVGQTVRVVVTYTDQQGFAETETSAASGTVANINDAPTGSVTITGAAIANQTLSVGNSLADADGLGTITYQWKADGTAIVGATGATLALTGGDVGKAISVVASYTDLHGTAESVASTAVTVAPVPANPPPTTTPPATTGTVIDGASVEVSKVPNSDGTVTQTTTIAPITAPGADQTADIPLFSENGQSLLSVSAPLGFSLTITGNDKPETAAKSADMLIRMIRGAGGDNGQAGSVGDFLTGLGAGARVLVQAVTPTMAPNADKTIPLTFDGGSPNDGIFTALVLDVSKLPSGTIINLQNIDFVTVVGAVRLGGGDGAQVVFGDDAEQYMVLGADDDVLHGGGGNDTIGSKGGNDKIYGDAGNDTLFGGEGNDLLDGGTGYDTVLMGGNLKDYVFIHTAAGLKSISFEGEDTMVNVEALKMADGTMITDLNRLVAPTTSVAVMTYQFFTGKTPTAGGLEYLLHAPDSVNASDLGDPYYQKFNVDNRYINFAINLASAQGQGHAWFAQTYGALSFEQTLTKAYKEIFGIALTDDRVQHLLYDQVGQSMTRLHYFELVAGSQEGAKAGLIGWLLSAAVLENTGRYAAANTAFLNDFIDGDAKLNVDLVAVYGDGHAWGALV